MRRGDTAPKPVASIGFCSTPGHTATSVILSGAQTEQREYAFAALGIIYSLRDGVSVRVAGRYVDSTALVGADYDRMTATVDVAAVF
jgi:hypothetical protein